MRPEHFTRVYNGAPHLADFASGKPRYPDARLFDKEEQLVQMAGRGFPGGGGGVGFHIELGERDAERRRAVYDSSDRDHEWTEEGRSRGGEEGYNGIVSGRSEVSVSHSDGSEDYDEELDLEADGGRDIVTERGGDGVAGERASEVLQSVAHSQDGAVPPFQRMNADRGRTDNAGVSAGQKFGMFSFLNPFSSPGAHNVGENGPGRESTANVSNGEAGVPDSMYFTSIVNSASGEIAVDFSGEKRATQSSEYSVRHFLSDPISGALMEDAVILPCGHSVGSAGFQRVQETNACVVCMRPTAPMSAAPNHALRVAVHAFRREREFPNSSNLRSAKRRRERFEQDDQPFDGGKVKGVQFPYSVSDRVLIKGNKRTPERFVGREAIITTQCLNGWYLVRTTDNGESVRLQYRSLQKLGD